MERFLWTILLTLIVAIGISVSLVVFFEPITFYFILFIFTVGYIINVLFALFLYFIKSKGVELIDVKKKYFRWSFKVGAVFGGLVVLLLVLQSSFGMLK